MLITYSFTVNPETKEVVFVGNIDSQAALKILQDIVISQAVQAATQKKEEETKEETDVIN